MATLTDAFLADLDALSDGDDDVQKFDLSAKEDIKEETGFMDFESIKADDIHSIATLSSTPKYQETLRLVDEEVAQHGDAMPDSWAGPSDADPTYRLIVTCNELAMSVDDEIAKTYAFIKQKCAANFPVNQLMQSAVKLIQMPQRYGSQPVITMPLTHGCTASQRMLPSSTILHCRYKKRFPELEGLVLEPLAYARVVERIGNEDNVIAIDFEDVIPRHVQMTVSVSASTTDGQALPPDELRKVMDACALAQQLEADRTKLHHFVGSRMALVAPNLSAVCGAEIAAKLVGAAGGLVPLSNMPACNIQVLGQRKRINAGLSSANVGANQGFVFVAPMVSALPPEHRRKGAKLVANKVALLARFDAYGTSDKRDGGQGACMREEMQRTLEKQLEPPPAAINKPLPKPDAVAKKRRGGARFRKQKEKMAATEMMKQANRMQFGKIEEEYIDGDEMFGLGMLGKDGHGKLKVMQAASKIKKKELAMQKAAKKGARSGGMMSGTASTLAFSHAQGIELENPNRAEEAQVEVGARASGTESYFSELSGFQSFRKLR